jgi:hypothetical protein
MTGAVLPEARYGAGRPEDWRSGSRRCCTARARVVPAFAEPAWTDRYRMWRSLGRGTRG